MNIREPLELLREAGIRNPLRVVGLIKETIQDLDLDLSGLTVLTEAASGPFVVTPVIAALSGAQRVTAVTRGSRYGSVGDVTRQTRALELLCDLEASVEIHSERPIVLFSEADIVTNLGFVRPIDAAVIEEMKQSAVVGLMCEPWEVRSEDVDISRCLAKGIAVVGVDETQGRLPIMQYCGWLVLKLLFESQIEAFRSKIGVLSGDKMGAVISDVLASCGLFVETFPNLREQRFREQLMDLDALVVADYAREDVIIGIQGDITAAELVDANPTLAVLPFAGRTDVAALESVGVSVHPAHSVEAHRMTMTLAQLGPRPVVELHAAGLKAAEMAVSAGLGEQSSPEEAQGTSGLSPLVHPVHEG